MSGWVNLCDSKKSNRNTGFYKSENIPHVMNLNRYKFLTEAKNKEISSVFIETVAHPKSWSV